MPYYSLIKIFFKMTVHVTSATYLAYDIKCLNSAKDQLTGFTVSLLLTYTAERNARFQLKVHEKKM